MWLVAPAHTYAFSTAHICMQRTIAAQESPHVRPEESCTYKDVRTWEGLAVCLMRHHSMSICSIVAQHIPSSHRTWTICPHVYGPTFGLPACMGFVHVRKHRCKAVGTVTSLIHRVSSLHRFLPHCMDYLCSAVPGGAAGGRWQGHCTAGMFHVSFLDIALQPCCPAHRFLSLSMFPSLFCSPW